jgi:hypothetical protein
MKTSRFVYLYAICLISLLGWKADAQTITGAVAGTVTDASGAPIPSANVTLLAEGTGATRTTATNETGAFVFDAVRPGSYTVTIEKPAFKGLEQKGLLLSASQRLTLGTIQLSLGAVQEKITVQARGEVVDLESSTRQALLTSRQMDLLITRGHDPINLVRTMPGVSQITIAIASDQAEGNITFGNQSPGGQYGTWVPTIQGFRTEWSSFSLDGQPGNDTNLMGAYNGVVAAAAVEEVKSILTTPSAEYGRNPGAFVSLITKSGTQNFHGSASWTKRHEMLNANDFFYNKVGLPKDVSRFSSQGFTLGGPIYIPNNFNKSKNKLFFFYALEDWRTKQPTGLNRFTVPTQLERTGDFSQSFDQNNKLIPIIDPLTKSQFPGNTVPSTRINLNGQAMLNLLPTPNQLNRTVTLGAYNYQYNDIAEVPKQSHVLRLDFHPSERDSIFIRGTRWHDDTQASTAIIAFNLPILKSHYLFTAASAQAGWTHTFSPTIVNEFWIGVRGTKQSGSPASEHTFDSVERQNRGITLGYLYNGPYASGMAKNPYNLIPEALYGGLPSAANLTVDSRLPIDGGNQRGNLSDNLSLSLGRHNPKFGVYFEYQRNSEGTRCNPLDGSCVGKFDFTRDTNNPGDAGDPYATAILGNFRAYTESSQRNLASGLMHAFEWFAQDTWKVTRRLTLNYGVRFSYFVPWQVRGYGVGSLFVPERYDPKQTPPLFQPAIDPATGKRVGKNPITGQLVFATLIGGFVPGIGNPATGMVTGDDTTYPNGWANQRPVQAAPRFGFAYDPTGSGRTAIRGGFTVLKQTVASSGVYLFRTNVNPPIEFNSTIFYSDMNSYTQSAGVLFPSGVNAKERDDKTPTVYNWTVGIQHNIGAGIVVDAAYVGNSGRHLVQSRDLNAIPYGARFLAANIDPTTGRALPDVFFRPYLGYQSIYYAQNSGISNYNAAQLTVNRRFAKGVQFGAAYTWSKAMDLTDTDGGQVSTFISQRIWNYGRAGYDETHMLSINYIWDLPNASKLWSNAFTRSVLDKWQVSGICTFASGLPYGINMTTTDGADIAGGGDLGVRVVMLKSAQLPHGDRTIVRWFDTSAFGRPAVGTVGNAAKDVVRGPGVNNWDLTLAKNIPFKSEARNLQFRWEVYNAFNHTQMQSINRDARFDPAGNQVNGLFGQAISARPARVMQLGIQLHF